MQRTALQRPSGMQLVERSPEMRKGDIEVTSHAENRDPGRKRYAAGQKALLGHEEVTSHAKNTHAGSPRQSSRAGDEAPAGSHAKIQGSQQAK